MHSDYPKWSQATSFVTKMKFRQVKRQKNCDKLSYDVSHKESCGTLCLLCYGIFPYSFSYVSLANAFGAAQLTQLLSSKLIQTAVIFKSFFKTEKPILRCHQYLFAPQAVWKSSRLHSAVSDKLNIIFLSMLLQDGFKCWLGVDLNPLRKNSCSIMAICRISHFLKFKCEIVHYTYLVEEAIPDGNEYCRW